VGRNLGLLSSFPGRGLLLSLSMLIICGIPVLAQSPPSPEPPEPATGTATRLSGQPANPQEAGSISGTVVDKTGTAVFGAKVKLTTDPKSPTRDALSDENGRFSFANVLPGPFQIAITSEGFAPQLYSGNLNSGENCVVPQIALTLATNVTEVRVEMSPVEIAQAELKEQEKQRVFGVIPNFYVSYVPKAAPLSTKQKFQLAFKSTVDPVTFGITGAIAGIEQAQNHFPGYGQGAEGYAKRYGATYADLTINTYLGGAILPSLLKQDPRYFYKGTGTKRSRALYAIANSFICKGDNGNWQPNYSFLLGTLASGGISNLYYPASDRHGAALTFENAAIGIAANAAANLLQEFVIRKLTPNLPNYSPPTP
jgi:Carboxypeptidase regulatory-like domain